MASAEPPKEEWPLLTPAAPAHWVVPSGEWPTLAAAVAAAEDGTHIELKAGYEEALTGPLILDKSVFLEGPPDASALLSGEDGLIVAAGSARNTVVLRRVRIRVSAAPALVICGGCTIDRCHIEATTVGIEVAARTGSSARILQTCVSGCEVGVSLAGGAFAAVLDGTRVEHCATGVTLTGLHVQEGWNEVLGSLSGVEFSDNSDADLRLRAWSVQEQATGIVRNAPPDEEVTVHGWPREQCSVVVPTDRGAVVLLFNEGRVNATLFEQEEDEDGPEAGDTPTAGTPTRTMSNSDAVDTRSFALTMQIPSEE